MPVDKPAQMPLPLIDDPTRPELFADAVVGFHHLNGVVKIALGSVRMSHATGAPTGSRVVVGRLVMSVPAARNLAVGLFEFLKKQGVDVAGVAATATTKAN